MTGPNLQRFSGPNGPIPRTDADGLIAVVREQMGNPELTVEVRNLIEVWETSQPLARDDGLPQPQRRPR